MPKHRRVARVALLLCIVGVAPAASAPMSATLAQLHSHPARYAGKLVRLRGQLDSCLGYACDLCPETMTPQNNEGALCLQVSFDGYPIGYADDAAATVSGDMQRLFRFATVTLEARFDPTCLPNYKPPGGLVVCSDYPSALLDARVIAVHARRTARDGLVAVRHDLGDFRIPVPDDARAMRQAYLAAFPNAQSDFRVFLDPVVDPAAEETSGKICVCRDGVCDGKWPIRTSDAIDTPANPFDCYRLLKRKDAWIFLGR